MKCPHCGAGNPEDVVSCLHCNTRSAQVGVHWAAGDVVEVGSAGSQGAALSPTLAIEALPRTLARLRVEHGALDEREFSLDAPSVSIGRRLGNDVVIHDTNVSRQHARIVRESDGYVLEDTNSANGTLLNGERLVEPRLLQAGDVIEIGDARLVFEVEPVEPADQPASGSFDPVDRPEAAARAERPVSYEWLESPAVASAGDERMAEPAAPADAVLDPVPFPDAAAAEDVRADASVASGESAQPAAAPLETARRELGDLRHDLADLGSRVGELIGRADGLEASVAEAGADLARLTAAATGAGGQSLRDLLAALDDLEATGSGERLASLRDLLDQLAEQPRDIDLLRQLAQEGETLRTLIHLHTRLDAAAPGARHALRNVLG